MILSSVTPENGHNLHSSTLFLFWDKTLRPSNKANKAKSIDECPQPNTFIPTCVVPAKPCFVPASSSNTANTRSSTQLRRMTAPPPFFLAILNSVRTPSSVSSSPSRLTLLPLVPKNSPNLSANSEFFSFLRPRPPLFQLLNVFPLNVPPLLTRRFRAHICSHRTRCPPNPYTAIPWATYSYPPFFPSSASPPRLLLLLVYQIPNHSQSYRWTPVAGEDKNVSKRIKPFVVLFISPSRSSTSSLHTTFCPDADSSHRTPSNSGQLIFLIFDGAPHSYLFPPDAPSMFLSLPPLSL